MKEEFVDLYKIVVKVDFEGVRGRMEKHRVKKTKLHYLAINTTKEMAAQGYSYGLGQRVRLSELMAVNRELWGGASDAIYRHIFCLEPDREAALDKLRTDIQEELERRVKNSTTLMNLWTNRDKPDKLKQKPSATSEANTTSCQTSTPASS